MTTRSTAHATFSIERSYDVPPDRVFAAFADPATKKRWFRGLDEWERTAYEMDFRVGGREINRIGPRGGPLHRFEARYEDIVPDVSIVFTGFLAPEHV